MPRLLETNVWYTSYSQPVSQINLLFQSECPCPQVPFPSISLDPPVNKKTLISFKDITIHFEIILHEQC